MSTVSGRDQLGNLPQRVRREPTPLPHLAVLMRHPVHRGYRADVLAAFQKDRVDGGQSRVSYRRNAPLTGKNRACLRSYSASRRGIS